MSKNQRKKQVHLKQSTVSHQKTQSQEVYQALNDPDFLNNFKLMCDDLTVMFNIHKDVNLFDVYTKIISRSQDKNYINALVRNCCMGNDKVIIHPHEWRCKNKEITGFIQEVMVSPQTYIELTPSMSVVLGSRMSISEVVERFVAIQAIYAAAQNIAMAEKVDISAKADAAVNTSVEEGVLE